MKIKFSVVIFFLSFSFAACQEGKVDKSDLKTQSDSVSYSIGINIGQNIKRQVIDNFKKDSVAYSDAMLIAGIKDALTKDSIYLLSQKEMETCLNTFQMEMMAKQDIKMRKMGEKNKKDGEEFLAKNKSESGVITLESGLQYKVLQSGKGEQPKETDKVKCNYKGTLVNGEEFDNSFKRGEPAVFPVNGVIKGWTEALKMMHVGDKWQLFVPYNLAYGEQGRPPQIPPSSTLIFEVELLSIEK